MTENERGRIVVFSLRIRKKNTIKIGNDITVTITPRINKGRRKSNEIMLVIKKPAEVYVSQEHEEFYFEEDDGNVEQ